MREAKDDKVWVTERMLALSVCVADPCDYATITPNYVDLQEGPSESGEQISREHYNTRLDTSNFLERLLGFGKTEITFKHVGRPPIRFLVWGIGKKAKKLEKVRAKFVIDHKQGRRGVAGEAAN